MERKKATEFPQELLDEYHLFVHGDMERRVFLDRLKKYAVGGLTVSGIMASLEPNFAWAQQVKTDDPRIVAETATVTSPGGHGSIKGHFARPKAAGKYPAVLVIHENRGLNPYIEDVARRLATEGFIAFAPDGLSSVGGYPGNEDQGRAMFAGVDRAKMTEDFIASAAWLKARPESTGKYGVVGFCFGGAQSNLLATRLTDLGAAVPFYGGAPPAADVPKIKAAVLVHHGSLDTGLVNAWPAYEAALKAAGVTYEGYVYQNANHGFHNDTTPRYDEAAAKLAWQRTVAWFKKHLA
jgi:carboxymethylenebutenolidase